jgi:hypothetical protein
MDFSYRNARDEEDTKKKKRKTAHKMSKSPINFGKNDLKNTIYINELTSSKSNPNLINEKNSQKNGKLKSFIGEVSGSGSGSNNQSESDSMFKTLSQKLQMDPYLHVCNINLLF